MICFAKKHNQLKDSNDLAAAIEGLAVHAGRGLFRNEIFAIAAELRGGTPHGDTMT